MSYSKSLSKGQIPICCQLCEESNQIKWKCIQCDFLLCTKCQKLHTKVKSTDKHTIIDIKDIAVYQQQANNDQNFSNFLCNVHSGKNCCLFCQTCEEVVCPLCIANIHNKHNMIELGEGYKLTVKKIKAFNHELDVELTDQTKGIIKMHSVKSSEDLKYEREKQKIQSRERVLKADVEKHTKTFFDELEKRRQHLKISVQEEETKSHEISKDLEFRKDSLSKALASSNTYDVFMAFQEEKAARKQSINTVHPHFKRLPQYIAGKGQIEETLHGELAEADDNYSQEEYEFKVMTNNKTGLKLVEMIIVCEDGTLWVSNYTDNSIQKIQFSKTFVKVLQNIQVYSLGMGLLKSGDLLISTGEHGLKMLCHTTGKITDSKYSVAPLITGPLHVTYDNKIIVRARKKGPLFPVNGPRQVVVMNIDGTTEKVYALDNNRKPIFTAPQSITSDYENNIYIVDSLNTDGCGVIVALDKINGVRWKYSCNSNITKEKSFKPRDLLATQLNNIIITDYDNQMIHILNTSGQCIHYINTKDQLGIELPYSLDIDNAWTLYIGCNTYELEPAEAKIYTVQTDGRILNN